MGVFWLHFTHLSKEEQERQAKQIRVLESEKLQQELLLQELLFLLILLVSLLSLLFVLLLLLRRRASACCAAASLGTCLQQFLFRDDAACTNFC